jgi:Arc/MetJ family transcription regulator
VYGLATLAPVGRTNIVIDDDLVARVMARYGLRTKREAVDYALRRLLEEIETPSEQTGDAAGDWWAAHFKAIRGHPLGE